jgi:DNA-binding XRE family transcriptional regulator
MHISRIELINKAIQAKDDCCIEWPYGTNKAGYPIANIKGKMTYIHIIVCTKRYGNPKSEQKCIRLCDNKRCISAKHLRWSIHKPIRRNGIGTNTYNAKLTLDDIKAVRNLWATGDATQAEIATALGVSRQTISNVISGRTYKESPSL